MGVLLNRPCIRAPYYVRQTSVVSSVPLSHLSLILIVSVVPALITLSTLLRLSV